MKRLSTVVAAGTLAAAVVLTPAAAQAETLTLPLTDAVASLTTAEEDRTGYERNAFRHWVDTDSDGCNTRYEVLIEEAVTAPVVDARCQLQGGEWTSYYDGVTHSDPRRLDIDHMVPLAEAWDSGASAWDADRRRDYANDLGDPRSLVAVTAAANRSKADQDPATWLPPSAEVHCRYISEWVAVKLRWGLAADPAEQDALTTIAADCDAGTVVDVTEAPAA
ncbi:HNH endonuclease family protein [Nocardiopsis sediminis]|uniref:HNH endonuclease family protein n=1 Tax=Nocardiopsis sediminis TaxID=1778267 RepID=A0ABV8FDU6_9ACTN